MFSRSIDGFEFRLCSRVYLKTSCETLLPILSNELSESFLQLQSWSRLWRRFMFFVNHRKSRQKPLTDAATWSKPQIPSSHIFDFFGLFRSQSRHVGGGGSNSRLRKNSIFVRFLDRRGKLSNRVEGLLLNEPRRIEFSFVQVNKPMEAEWEEHAEDGLLPAEARNIH